MSNPEYTINPSDAYSQEYNSASNVDIDAELDALLSGKTPEPATQPPVNDNNAIVQAVLEEQRQQRLFQQQQYAQQQQLAQRTALEQEEALRQQHLADEAKARINQYGLSVEIPQITDDLKSTYQNADPYIKALVAQAIASYNNGVSNALVDTQRQLLELQQRTANNGLSVEQMLTIRKPDYTRTVQTPEFNQYLQEAVPQAGNMTRRDILDFAYKRGDVNAIASMLDEFESLKGKHSPTISVTPSATATHTPSGGSGTRPKRKLSDLDNLHAMYRQGKITPEQYQRGIDAFEHSASLGEVDYNS